MLIRLAENVIYNGINGDLITYYPDWQIDSGEIMPLLEFAPDDLRMLKGEEATRAWEKLCKVARMDEVDMAFDHEQTLDAAEKYRNQSDEDYEPDF